MVRSTIQRMGSTTKPLAWSARLTISITKLGMTLAIASSSYRPNLGIFKQRRYQMAFMLLRHDAEGRSYRAGRSANP